MQDDVHPILVEKNVRTLYEFTRRIELRHTEQKLRMKLALSQTDFSFEELFLSS